MLPSQPTHEIVNKENYILLKNVSETTVETINPDKKVKVNMILIQKKLS